MSEQVLSLQLMEDNEDDEVFGGCLSGTSCTSNVSCASLASTS